MSYKSPFPLLDATYETLQKAAVEDSKLRVAHSENGDAFWPSAASIVCNVSSKAGYPYEKVEGTCLRQAAYKMLRVPETDATSPTSMRIMAIGTVAEDIYKEWFHGVDGYRVVFPDIRGKKIRFNSVFNDIRVRGEVDLIMEHIETGTRFGVEMKTYEGSIAAANLCGPDAAKEVHKAWIPPDYIDDRAPFPKIQNLLQTMLYLQEFWKDGIHLWKIVYAARDKGPDATFDVTLADINGEKVAVVDGKAYPEFTLSGIYARYSELKKHLDSKTLPPRDYVPEYDPDFLLTGRISITHGSSNPRSVVAHELWKEKLDARAGNPRGKKTREEIYKTAMSEFKADWQCNYCSFRDRCVNETSDHSLF